MQRHRAQFLVDAPRPKVWRALHPLPPPDAPSPRIIDYPGGRIEVLSEGNEDGQGLVRTCTFCVPKLLGTGGVARSWECVVEARAGEYSRYVAVGKPIWSRAEGWQELEDAPGGGTLLTFTETYEAMSPLTRPLEGWVHRFISKDNNAFFLEFIGRAGAVTEVS